MEHRNPPRTLLVLELEQSQLHRIQLHFQYCLASSMHHQRAARAALDLNDQDFFNNIFRWLNFIL